MNKQLLDKWLNGLHTAEDLKVLEKDPTFAMYRKIDLFAKRIELPEVNTETSLQVLKSKLKQTPQTKSKVRTLPILLKIAAVLALLVASYVFINSLPTTTHTQIAQTKTLVLPDSSEVVLNENSEISYKENSWKEARELSLEGEAYFKVAKGKTFTVNTSQGSVTVLGTQFNVKARNGKFEVICYEGSVAVKHDSRKIRLEAGSGVTITNGEIQNSIVLVSKPEWIGNESSYDNVRIADVLSELETNYGITVTTQNIDVTLRFTGSYTHTDLDAALQTITLPLGLTYAFNNETNISIFPTEKSE